VLPVSKTRTLAGDLILPDGRALSREYDRRMTDLRRARMDLVTVLTAGGVSMLGSAASFVAVPWFVLSTTGSAAKTGLVGAAAGLGAVVSGLVFAPLIDRMGHRRVSVTADLLAAMAIATVPWVGGGIPLWTVAGLVFASSAASMASSTARQSMLPGLSARAGAPLSRASALYWMLQRAALAFAAVPAALLIAAVGPLNVLWADSATFLAAAAILGLRRLPAGDGEPGQMSVTGQPRGAGQMSETGQPRGAGQMSEAGQMNETGQMNEARQPREAGGTGSRHGFREGWRFIRTDRFITLVLATAILLTAIEAPLVTLVIPVLTVASGPESLGHLVLAYAGGMLAGAAILAVAADRIPRRALAVSCLAVVGSGYIGLALLPPSWWVAVLALMGVATGPLAPLIVSSVQQRTPRRMVGQVTGALLALVMAAIPLGRAVGGYAIQAAGLEVVLATCALAYLVTMAFLAYSKRSAELLSLPVDGNKA
jgi:predicted MFS family arabinose efflux permease